MDDNQTDRIARAREVLSEDQHPQPGRDPGQLLFDLAERVGKLEYWLHDIIALAAELDAAPPPPPTSLASCGHPRDEDGECSCSWWPERAPASLAGYGYTLPEDYLRGCAQ